MKFYNIITTHNQSEIDVIIMSFTPTETEYITKLYSEISIVEYTNDSGNECMFALLDDYLMSKIDKLYKKYDIRFQAIDMTKDIILDNQIKISYKNYNNKSVKNQVLGLIKEYKTNWITKDDILDKILEKGINSLNDFDLEVLNS